MSLLVDMATASLDPEYRDAAAMRERRAARAATRDAARGVRRTTVRGATRTAAPEAASPGPGGVNRLARWRRVPVRLTSLLLLAGLVAGLTAAQVRDQARETGAIRASLVEDVRRQTAATDALAAEEAALRRDVGAVRSRILGEDTSGNAASQGLAALELVTGAVAVHGPGVVVTLRDAPRADAPSGTGAQSDGRIYDRDLQQVANALWAAGAEQMAINGQRLTAQTAIRSAGDAILVDFRPLTQPYLLQAIGDVDGIESRFVDGAVARTFQSWTSLYGIGFSVARAAQLRLPAAGPADLRLARPRAR